MLQQEEKRAMLAKYKYVKKENDQQVSENTSADKSSKVANIDLNAEVPQE
jgi:hypothetical protein